MPHPLPSVSTCGSSNRQPAMPDTPDNTVSQWGWMNSRMLYHNWDPQNDIGRHLPQDTGYFRLVFFTWNSGVADITRGLGESLARRPQDAFHFLCSDEFQARDLAAAGLSARHVSHNAFLDESLYPVAETPPRSRRFEAVCISRMSRFKRHHLAQAVPRVLFIGSVVADGDDQAYFEELAALMPRAEFTHRETRWLTSPEVARRANDAAVGLILSEVEGGSYATTEYMLCGLPVVSTASIGGRDSWLHPRFSRVVPASVRAIAEAVEELIAHPPNPHDVRDHALRVMCEQRRRFFELGQQLYEVENTGRDFARDFYACFRQKMADWQPNRNVMDVWRRMFPSG
jgi:glycosyltransferase involved in cell wall biosynthesis